MHQKLHKTAYNDQLSLFQIEQKKSMQLPSLVSYDFKSTVDSVAETVGTIYG